MRLNKNNKNGKLKDRSLVHIKPRAYWKMRTHVLRFGNKALARDDYKEILGMLIGRNVKGKDPGLFDVIIEDAVPVTHGDQIEVGFRPEDYVRFTNIDAQFAEKDLFTVGWYHSHPGLTTFFSSTDVLNQLGFQVANASAIGIVFDHERFINTEDMGFDIFRLNDPNDGPSSDYHKVAWKLDPPNDPSFFSECIKGLIEQYHKKEPIILELSEVPSIFGAWKLPKVERFRQNFSDASLEPIITALESSKHLFGENSPNLASYILKILSSKIDEIGDQYSENMTIIFKLLKQIDQNLSMELAGMRESSLKHFSDQITSLLNYQHIEEDFDLEIVYEKLMQLERIQENMVDEISNLIGVSKNLGGAENE